MARKKKTETIDVGKIKATKKQASFAKELGKTGSRRKALKAAEIETNHPRQVGYQMANNPAIVAITNATRAQIRNLNPLSMDEIKQLTTELSMVSLVDLAEDDGALDIKKIKERGLGRFIKEIEQDVHFKTDGSGEITKLVTMKIKGYSRLDALKLLSTIQKDEENRDIQIVQAIAGLFTAYPRLQAEPERTRVFQTFAGRFSISLEKIQEIFEKFGETFLPKNYINGELLPNDE